MINRWGIGDVVAGALLQPELDNVLKPRTVRRSLKCIAEIDCPELGIQAQTFHTLRHTCVRRW